MMSMYMLKEVDIKEAMNKKIFKRLGYHKVDEFNRWVCLERANEMVDFSGYCNLEEYIDFAVRQYEALREQESAL